MGGQNVNTRSTANNKQCDYQPRVPLLCDRDLPSLELGSHFDSQPPDLRENDTKLYFVRFSVCVESKEVFQKKYSYKTTGTLNDVKRQPLSCYVNI